MIFPPRVYSKQGEQKQTPCWSFCVWAYQVKPVVTDGKTVFQICSLLTVQILYIMCSKRLWERSWEMDAVYLALSGALWMRQDGADGEERGSCCEQLGWPCGGSHRHRVMLEIAEVSYYKLGCRERVKERSCLAKVDGGGDFRLLPPIFLFTCQIPWKWVISFLEVTLP